MKKWPKRVPGARLQALWIATFILLPISVYLTYKATNDSNLFNAEWYTQRYKKLKAFFNHIFAIKRKNHDKTECAQ